MSQNYVSLISIKARPEKLQAIKDFVRGKTSNDDGVVEVFSLDSVIPMPAQIKMVVGGALVSQMEQPPFEDPRKIVFNPESLQSISNEEFRDVLFAMRNIRNYGQASWWDWSLVNWGTKWDAFDTSYEGHQGFKINTKGQAPFAVFAALSAMYREVQIDVKVASDIRTTPKYLRYTDGHTTNLQIFDAHTEDAMKFSCDVLGRDMLEEINTMRREISKYGAPRSAYQLARMSTEQPALT